jgi:hypothetical protein
MEKEFSILPSRGGIVPYRSIIGRNSEIDELWNVLESQSIAMFAERRFGKSSILRMMEKNPKKGFIFIYKPIEGLKSNQSVAEGLINLAREKKLIDEGFYKKLESLYNKTTELVGEVGKIKFGKFQYTWQKQLIYLFYKLIEKNKKQKLVIALDEFSIFLSKIDPVEAKAILGFFRDIVHIDVFINLRFIYNGSIGIDLVIDKLKLDGQNIGDPLNHMYKYSLPTFSTENAIFFGKCLKLGCELVISNKLIKQICEKSNNIPYFIDVIFGKISKSNKKINQKIIDDAFEEIIDDTSSRESINHFYDRIKDFYPNYLLSVTILNFISKNDCFISEREIISNVNANMEVINPIIINDEIRRLKKDGYLIRKKINNERNYDFKFSLLKLWWNQNKA